MVRMSRSVRRTFCRCSSAGLVVRVVDISSGHGGEGRVRRIDITVTPYAAPQSEENDTVSLIELRIQYRYG